MCQTSGSYGCSDGSQGCTGSGPTCPAGASAKCTANGWGCTDGSQGCSGNGPRFFCPPNASAVCTANGWACSDGSPGCPNYSPAVELAAANCYLQNPPTQPICTTVGWGCTAPPQSPIIIDTMGQGFHLTDVSHGVVFTFLPGSSPVHTSWTDPAYANGFLALDRNGNGIIDNATELFGNLTQQPKSNTPNGYLALAAFDRPENGGNGNGVIDPGDAVFHRLRIWIDKNHNGISEPGELYTLRQTGIFRIDLKYYQSEYVDQHGNEFRYKARVWDEAGVAHDLCYDVFLQIGSPR